MSSTSNAHLMHITRRGRPWCKDIYDLFATLLISLRLSTHRNFFKTYPHSFTFEEASVNLTSLKFSQSSRSTDPKDPSRIITTTTTTTFTMTREMGKAILQHFMDARLLENALDIGSMQFKERGIYVCTAKGLHIIERFITKNGIATHHLEQLFADAPVIMRCFHLERRSSDDDIYINKALLHVIWTRMVGLKPNVTTASDDEIEGFFMDRWWQKEILYDKFNPDDGLVVRKVAKEDKRGGEEYQFTAVRLLRWLLDYTTVTGPDCAAELAAQMVRYGLISLVHDRGKVRDKDWVVTVRAGGAGGGAGAMLQEAEFRATERAVYRITAEGMAVARWTDPHTSKTPNLGSNGPSRSNLHSGSTSSLSRVEELGSTAPTDLSRSNSNKTERERPHNHHHDHLKDSHTARLRQILNEPAVRSLFREYLRKNFCEENLSFWLEVQDLKRKFATSSSAVGSASDNKEGTDVAGQLTMEKHQQELLNCAFVIFNKMITYMTQLAAERDATPASTPAEQEKSSKLTRPTTSRAPSSTPSANSNAVGAGAIHASQVQNTVRMYERIQGHIFRLMATDSVPKFCKTEQRSAHKQFMNVMSNLIDFADTLVEPDDPMISDMSNLSMGDYTTPKKVGGPEGVFTGPLSGGGTAMGPGGGFGVNDGEPARAFVTISQSANEKAARMEKLLQDRKIQGR